MLLEVDGWQGGGKSVLTSLLDSHPAVFSSLVHDYSYRVFLRPESDWVQLLRRREAAGLRSLLATTRYFAAEDAFLSGESVFDISSSVRMRVPFEFDFYAFDQQVFRTLQSQDIWTPESITHLIYQCMAEKSGALQESTRYFATMSVPTGPDSRRRFSVQFPNGKSILVYRDPRNILTTRANRSRLSDAKGDDGYAKEFSALLKNFELERIAEYYAIHRASQRRAPQKFFEVNFSDLVGDTATTMKSVAEFLQIEWDDVLTRPTRLGLPLEQDGVSMIGCELDQWDALLTADQQRAVKRRMRWASAYQQQYQLAQLLVRRVRPVIRRVAR